MSDKLTLGAKALLALENQDATLDAREQGAWMSENFLKEIQVTMDSGKKAIPGEDFFIVILQKNERVLHNVLRNYFMYRRTCPTPNYDQIVYRYDHKTDDLHLVWTLPAREVCLVMLENAAFLDPELYELLKYIQDFKEGELARLAFKLNKEEGLIQNLSLEIQ